MLMAAQGYAGYRLGSVLGTLAGTAVLATPLIVAVKLTQTGPLAIRLGVLPPCGAVYGFALAFAGVRLAAAAAAGKMPELSQVAVRSAMS